MGYVIAIVVVSLFYFIAYRMRNTEISDLIPFPIIIGSSIFVGALVFSFAQPHKVKNVELLCPDHVIVTEIGVSVKSGHKQEHSFSQVLVKAASERKDLTYVASYDEANIYGLTLGHFNRIVIFDDEVEIEMFKREYGISDNKNTFDLLK